MFDGFNFVAGLGLEPRTFGLCIPPQFSLHTLGVFCSLDCLFTLDFTVGYLPFSLYTFLLLIKVTGLARDYHTCRLPRI